MAEKKSKPKTKKTPSKKAVKSKEVKSKSKNKTTKKTRKSGSKEESLAESGIIIVDDDLSIDKEKENEERRAYLEEARSQEAFD